MSENKNTFSYLKKRIFSAIDECCDATEENLNVSFEQKDLCERLPDAVFSSLVRMYCGFEEIGKESKMTLLYNPSLIAFSKSVGKNAKENISFSSDSGNIAIYFKFFGSGELIFENEGGEVLESILLDVNGTFENIRQFVKIPRDEKVYVRCEGDCKLADFAVYERAFFPDVGAVTPKGFVSFKLPEDCFSVEKIHPYGKEELQDIFFTHGNYGFIDEKCVPQREFVLLTYKKRVPKIDGDTSDDYAFDLSPLGFEMLVCLSAAELCRESEQSLYTRLLYKYKDLSEGMYTSSGVERRKNSFFSKRIKRGI